MRAVVQRVRSAAVRVDEETVGEIGPGLAILLGVGRGDHAEDGERLAAKIADLRVFADESGRMNRDITQVGGDLLLVPQFTLAADTDAGHRPSFSGAAPPELGRRRFAELVESLRRRGQAVATGEFGADMQVALVNDGPVTFLLRVRSDH